MDVRKRFSINLSFGKERSPLHFDTIEMTYVRSAISMFGKVSCTPLFTISLCRKNLYANTFLFLICEDIRKRNKLTHFPSE